MKKAGRVSISIIIQEPEDFSGSFLIYKFVSLKNLFKTCPVFKT